jgi:hypothetical protein
MADNRNGKTIMYVIITAIATAAATCLFGYFSIFYNLNERLSRIEGLIQNIQTSSNKNGNEIIEKSSYEQLSESIIELIKNQQNANVKISVNDNNCFTMDDYNRFVNNGVPVQIVTNLNNESSYKRLKKEFRSLKANEQMEIKEKASKTYKLTWTEIGKISKEGQTDVGQKAEKIISDAIMNDIANK